MSTRCNANSNNAGDTKWSPADVLGHGFVTPISKGTTKISVGESVSAFHEISTTTPVTTSIVQLTEPHTNVCGTISTNTAWPLSGSPYVLTCGVTVAAGVTLTVEPGVMVMGQSGTQLQIRGDLQALGTPTQPITFTSALDTGPSQWYGLVFVGGTGHLRHVTVRYGGQPIYNPAALSGNIDLIDVLSGEVLIEDSLVTAGNNGIDMTNSRVTIRNSQITANVAQGVLLRYTPSQVTIDSSTIANNVHSGMYFSNNSTIPIVVSNTTFRNNGASMNNSYGLYADGASTALTVSGCTFLDHTKHPVAVSPASLVGVTFSDNTFSGNNPDRILVKAGTIAANTTLVPSGGPLELDDGVTVAAGVTLTVEPGVMVMGQSGTQLQIRGDLQALGTPTQPITFTSALDTGPSQWYGLVFVGGTGHLRHVTVRYGRNNADPRNAELLAENSFFTQGAYGIWSEDSQVTLINSHCDNNLYGGLFNLTSGTIIAQASTFDNNTVGLASTAPAARLTINDGSISDNTGTGLVVGSSMGQLTRLTDYAQRRWRHGSQWQPGWPVDHRLQYQRQRGRWSAQ